MKQATVVFASFAGLFFSYSPFWVLIQGVLIKDISADLGFSRTQVSSGFALSMLTTVVVFPVVGRLIDFLGAKRVIITGACLLPLALAAFSQVPSSFAVFGALAIFAGLAGVMVTPLTYLSILPQWFDRRLGMALGIASMGVAFGQAILPLVAQRIASALTWRGAYLVLALVLVVFAIPNAIFLIRENHELPKGDDAQSAERPGMTLTEAVRTPVFWQLAVSFLLMIAVTSSMMAHLVPYLTDRGTDPKAAAMTLFIIGMTSLAGRAVTGFLLDRIRMSYIGFAFFAGCGLGMLLLGTVPPSLPLAYAVGILIGAAAGAEGDIMAFATRRQFGMRAYGNIFGMFWAIFSIGPIIGPVLMALSFDQLGSYQPMMLVFAGVSVFAALLMLAVRPGRYEVQHGDHVALAVPLTQAATSAVE
jgi:MFS family permease